MYNNMKIVILILLLFTGGGVADAQRHYKRISALEAGYGTNIFGEADNFANISFSKYIDRESYWKAGLNYLEKGFDYSYSVVPDASQLGIMPAMENLEQKGTARNWFVNGSYNRTIASNLKSIYWNMGIGCFLGTEYTKHPSEEYQFIIGPEIGTEIELFILPKLAITLGIKEMWSPLSLKKWNTVWNAGLKVLLYK